MILVSPFIVLPILVLASMEEILRVFVPSLHRRIFYRQSIEFARSSSSLDCTLLLPRLIIPSLDTRSLNSSINNGINSWNPILSDDSLSDVGDTDT